MTYSLEEVYETVRMTLQENFDIRTVTLGINLKDCVDSNIRTFRDNIYNRITPYAKRLVSAADEIEKKYGIPIINKRISVTPIGIISEGLDQGDILAIAQTLDDAARDAEIDFIGGYGSLVQKGMTVGDKKLISSLPEALSSTKRVCSFVNLASSQAGMNMDAILLMGHTIKEISKRTERGVGCARLVVFANAPEDNPFMAGAFHGIGEPDFSLNVGISGPGVIRSVVEKNPDCDITSLSEIIKKTAFKITRAGELIGKELASSLGVPFGIVDLSLASTTAVGDSVARIIEAMGIERIGAHGSTAALALLVDAVKKGGAMASDHVGGLSGTFIPVTEDKAMAEAVRDGALSLEKLEAMTAVCSVGLDMFLVPGSTKAETISAIIADELSIGVVNNKTTGVRIIPVPGAKPGDWVDFGGLLGGGPVMRLSGFSSSPFITRGGRFPNTITNLRN